MKYPIGSKFKARMNGSGLLNDFIIIEVIGFNQRGHKPSYEYELSYTYTRPERVRDNRVVYQPEETIDSWLAKSNWEYTRPKPIVTLDEELFTL